MADTEKTAPAPATPSELAKLRERPIAPLNGQPTTDQIGRKLDWSDADKAQAQQREAVAIRNARVAEDTERLHRGLPPKFADV